MTTSEPDPRTDLAGYLGLDADDIEECRIDAIRYPKVLTGKVGARLIEQDQARADEPGDGLHAMLDIDALGGPKMLRETMCVAQGAVLREGHAGAQLHADRIASIIDVCDQHRPLGPDGKHGTRQCTLTCGCIDKRDPEPDDGQLWSLGWTDANGEPVLTDLSRDDIEGFCEWVEDDRYVSHAISSLARSWQAALPAPKPPWKSPLDNLPDLTEQQCRDAYDATMADPDMPYLKGVIGRALIAAGWTLGEADRG